MCPVACIFGSTRYRRGVKIRRVARALLRKIRRAGDDVDSRLRPIIDDIQAWRADWPYSSCLHVLHATTARRAFEATERELERTGIREGSGSAFVVVESATIPRLAWLGHQDGTGWSFVIGSGVERQPHGFYEGVWAGPFAHSNAAETGAAFGSGVLAGSEWVTFMTPSHPYEHTWVLQAPEETYVSNSLAFALEAAGISESGALFTLLERRLIEDTFEQARRGVDRARLTVAKADGWVLFRMAYFDFTVDRAGKVRRIWREPRLPPRTFTAYRAMLSGTIGQLFENGASPARAIRLSPLTTVSSGYDSTALTVLARQHGCTRAATIEVKVTGTEDSGRLVADALGMDTLTFRHIIADDVPNLRFDFDGRLADQIAEFIATAGVGDDVTFKSLEPALRDTVLITGSYGDAIWGHDRYLRPGIAPGTPFGKSITEFRLRVGFAHVPAPTINARFNWPIKRLTRSRGMRPWSVGGLYDRPIPRRIAEEAGIPRHLFGQKKAATAPLATNHRVLFPAAMEEIRGRYRRL